MTVPPSPRQLPWKAALVGLAALAAACAQPPGRPLAVQFTPTPAQATISTPTATPLSPTATPGCAETSGRIEALTYPGRVVREPIPLRVYLPPCYDGGTDAYPVAYLFHGKPYDDSHWEILGVGLAADEGIASGAWPPFVLVLPLLPEPIFSNSDGGTWSYEEEMVEGLVPFVDSTFRTEPRAQARAIAGISRGGIWALEIGFRNPSLFGAVVALSPALAVNHPRPDFDPFEIARQAQELPPRILLLAGVDDWARPETERLARVLDEAGWAHEMALLPGEHADPTWQAALQGILQFLVDGWASDGPGAWRPATEIP